MSYATLALVTDYDTWHETVAAVSVEAIVTILQQTVIMAQRIIGEALPNIPVQRGSPYRDALKGTIISDPSVIPAHIKRDLAPLIGKYLPAETSPAATPS
jgi:5'-methylthioadenosine phosphorylase